MFWVDPQYLRLYDGRVPVTMNPETTSSTTFPPTEKVSSTNDIDAQHQCIRCGVVSDNAALFCIGCGKKLDDADRQNFITMAKSAEVLRDAKYVYPRFPALSPHFCWASLSTAGLGHIIFGQYGKGFAFAFITIVLQSLTNGYSNIPLVAIALIDSYRVGKALKDGRAVRKWQFFP